MHVATGAKSVLRTPPWVFGLGLLMLLITGCETQTNTTTDPGNDFTCAISTSSNPRYVIAWGTDAAIGSSPYCQTMFCKVFARVFDGYGVPVTGDILVAQGYGYEKMSVAINNATGGFVVVYVKYLYNSYSQNIETVWFQQYSSSGSPLGSVQWVGNGQSADITMTPSGQFDIVYLANLGADSYQVYVKRYNASGGWLGGVTVDNSTRYSPTAIKSLCNGDFIVAYDSDYHSYVRRFFGNGGGSNGNRITLSRDLVWNDVNSNPLIYNPNGSFAVVTTPPITSSNYGYYLDRYDSSGSPKPSEFLWTPSAASYPSINADSCGDYALIYEVGAGYGQVGPVRVMMKQYSYADVPGMPFQVNVTALPP